MKWVGSLTWSWLICVFLVSIEQEWSIHLQQVKSVLSTEQLYLKPIFNWILASRWLPNANFEEMYSTHSDIIPPYSLGCLLVGITLCFIGTRECMNVSPLARVTSVCLQVH